MIQKVSIHFSDNIELYIKRIDLIDNQIPGNKYFKLKYNIEEAKKLGKEKLITFGGAYSNHILAVSYAGKRHNLKTYAFIRGEELESKYQTNSQLKIASENGMNFVFVSRSDYREKNKLLERYFREHKESEYYIVPEGGTNSLAVKGTEEILGNDTENYDYICTAVGTGGTLAGITNAKLEHQKVLGFPALKDSEFLVKEIKKYTQNKFELIQEYHFGGYAKKNEKLINFVDEFNKKTNIIIEPIYTGKMMYGVFEEIKKGKFKSGSKILTIHTGGVNQ